MLNLIFDGLVGVILVIITTEQDVDGLDGAIVGRLTKRAARKMI